MVDQKSNKGQDKELDPKFEATVKRMLKTPPKPKKAKHNKTSKKQNA